MNYGRYYLASFVVWVYLFAIEFIFHGLILTGQYEGMKHIMRPEGDMGAFFLWVIIAYLILALGLCKIFIVGYQNQGVPEGLRFGLLVGITFGLSHTFINHAVFPFPEKLTLAIAFGYVAEMIIAGVLIALMYKPKS